MTRRITQSPERLASAWREFELRSPVRFQTIATEQQYRAMIEFMNELLDVVGDDESHSLIGLLDVVAILVEDFEQRSAWIPDAKTRRKKPPCRSSSLSS